MGEFNRLERLDLGSLREGEGFALLGYCLGLFGEVNL